MNSPIAKYFLIFTFLYATFLIDAQEHLNTLKKADSLFHAGHTMAGMVEYERVVFESNDYNLQQKAIFGKAMARKQKGDYELAARELERIVVRDPNDSLFALKAYELAFCQYMTREYQTALGTIDLYFTMLEDQHRVRQNLLTLKVFCHNHLFQYEDAQITITKLANSKNEKNGDKYAQLLSYYDNTPVYRNPERARHLSIIPGLGQAYCGEVAEGSVSFLLNASALGFGAWQVYSGYYFTGYIVGVSLLQKFHSGGQHRAEILAGEKNRENILKFNTKVTGLLLKSDNSHSTETDLLK